MSDTSEPRPPIGPLDVLHDSVHTESGVCRPAKSVKVRSRPRVAAIADLSLPELIEHHAVLLEAIAIHLDALRRVLSRDVADAVSRYLARDATELRAIYAEAWRRGVRL